MESRILQLISALRASGVRVSLAESAEAFSAVADASTNRISPAGSSLQALQQHAHIKVETNGAPVATSTNGIPRKEKSFEWKSSCEGWNGVRLELTRKTLLGQLVPGVTNVEQRNLAKAVGLPLHTTNNYRVRLEEAQMNAKISGKLALDGAAYVTGKQFHNFDDGFEVRRALPW